jgi:lysozyme
MAVLKTEYVVAGGIIAVIAWVAMFRIRLVNKLSAFIPSVEGFRSSPYWDVNRWSWGYGTAAPGATGTITRENAFAEMLSYLLHDYEQLKPKITRSLTVAQWAAYLSFAYNLGAGSGGAKDLVPYINAGNDTALATQWKKYIYAGGVVNQDLVARRNKELALWFS